MLRKLAVGSAILGSVFVAPAYAQAPSSNVFTADYFARFNPRTADDMVRQLPGFQVERTDGDIRGFGGAGGNVLINGERPSTKQEINDVLRRIPASNVLRIEIVTSASGDLDMRGQTKIANVIVQDIEEQRTPVNWEFFLRLHQRDAITSQIRASTTMKAFGGNLTLDFTGGQRRLGGPGNGPRDFGAREFFDADGVQFEGQSGIYHNESIAVEPAFAFERDFSWGALRLNGEWDGCCGDGDSYFTRFAPDVFGDLIGVQTSGYESDSSTWTFGGDVERSFGNGASAKLIVLNERGDSSSDNTFAIFDAAGAFGGSRLSESESEDGETIVRGQINMPLGQNHSLGFALEGAYNFLDSTRTVADTSAAGIVRDTTPAGSDTIVEEFRGELEISDIWSVSPRLTIEPLIKFEVSQIRQEIRIDTGPVKVERDFSYPKPGISATWRPNETEQVRLSYVRDVAQLDFGDFVSSVDLRTDFVTGGNAQLEPEQTWAASAEYERQFWGAGVFGLRAGYDQIEQVQDLVCIIPAGAAPDPTTPCVQRADTFDAPGNIGDGTRWSLGTNITLPLARFGIKGGRFDFDYSYSQTAVTDPVTGLERRFSNSFEGYNFTAEFRQDLTDLQFSWGVEVQNGGDATAFRRRETFRRELEGTSVDLFVETTRFAGLNMRLGYNNALDNEFQSIRVIYDGPRSTGSPSIIERGYSRNGPFTYLRIAGAF